MNFITCLTSIRESGGSGRGRGEKKRTCTENILADDDFLRNKVVMMT